MLCRFQESSSWIEGFFSRGDDDEWTLAAGLVQPVLKRRYLFHLILVSRALEPRGYVKLRTVRLIGIILSVFCLQHHLTYIRNRDAQSTMMGFWNMVGHFSFYSGPKLYFFVAFNFSFFDRDQRDASVKE